jgi:N-acyl-D-aspartate/D-glutamate deacylase/CubicO group peptidase (beta-lactamase class C family)
MGVGRNQVASLTATAFLFFWVIPGLADDQVERVGRATQIEEILTAAFADDGPGISLIAMHHGQIIYQGVRGKADIEHDVSLDPSSVFRIGSITKQFTAAAIMMLAEQGKLSLEDDITKFLPDYPTQGHAITVEHLLTHTSGIKSYTGIPGWMSAGVKQDLSLEELIGVFKNLPMDFAPGTKFKYNNSGYVLLGAIIEKASGVDYESFIQQKIFDALDMKRSYYGSHRRIIVGRASGYNRSNSELSNAEYLSMFQPHAAGSLLSTTGDLAKWNAALFSGRVVSLDSLERMTTPYKLHDGTKASFDDGYKNYGYGLVETDVRGHRAIAHAGGINGFASYAVFLPDEEVYVAVLTNVVPAKIAPEVIGRKVAALLAESPYPGSSDKVDVPPRRLRKIAGVYRGKHHYAQNVVVTEADGNLVVELAGRPRMNAFAVSDSEFFVENSLARLEFVDGHDDSVQELRLFPIGSSKSISAVRTNDRMPSDSAAHSKVRLAIRGGALIDGTGGRRTMADIEIIGDRITRVGTIDQSLADIEIDATGMVVAPGFIDVHNHSERDIAQPDRRLNEGFVRQGVTTIVGGADGSLEPNEIRSLIAAYQTNGVGTNVALYVGHGAIRGRVLLDNPRRAANDAELAEMKSLVDEGMRMGAVGLSTGLMYPPGMYASTDEVVAMTRMVAPYGGIYDSHVRNPVHELLESNREVVEICRRAGVAGKMGHLKAVGLHNEGVIRDVIKLVEESRRSGLTVVSDQYPYDGAQTSTLKDIVVIPPELLGGDFRLKAALADRSKRALLRHASENGLEDGFAWLKATGYSSMRVVRSTEFPELVGKYLSELADEGDFEPFDLVAEILMDAKKPILITLGAIKEADVRQLLVQPWNMIASDGMYVDSTVRGSLGHPRSTGTFPRVLGHYVRDLNLLSLEEAIRKMTSLPANFLNLNGRGRIQEGFAADIVVFNPDTICDTSTWMTPNSLSVGIRDLLVNGVPVLRGGELTGDASGRLLRPNRVPVSSAGEN